MKQSEIAERLTAIEAQLTALTESQIGGSVPAAHVSQALADIEHSYGLIGQLVEMAHAQREQIEALIQRLDTLIAALAAHDARLIGYGDANEQERYDLHELMMQLRELARKQVAGLADVERAVGAGDGAWSGTERRNSIADRRRVP